MNCSTIIHKFIQVQIAANYHANYLGKVGLYLIENNSQKWNFQSRVDWRSVRGQRQKIRCPEWAAEVGKSKLLFRFSFTCAEFLPFQFFLSYTIGYIYPLLSIRLRTLVTQMPFFRPLYIFESDEYSNHSRERLGHLRRALLVTKEALSCP